VPGGREGRGPTSLASQRQPGLFTRLLEISQARFLFVVRPRRAHWKHSHISAAAAVPNRAGRVQGRAGARLVIGMLVPVPIVIIITITAIFAAVIMRARRANTRGRRRYNGSGENWSRRVFARINSIGAE
jgi:hypothetical protein